MARILACDPAFEWPTALPEAWNRHGIECPTCHLVNYPKLQTSVRHLIGSVAESPILQFPTEQYLGSGDFLYVLELTAYCQQCTVAHARRGIITETGNLRTVFV